MNDTCRKTMHMEPMDRGFTVFSYFKGEADAICIYIYLTVPPAFIHVSHFMAMQSMNLLHQAVFNNAQYSPSYWHSYEYRLFEYNALL
jgi:hypothetical protein